MAKKSGRKKKKMSKKVKIGIGTVVLIAVVAGIAAGVFYYKSKQNPSGLEFLSFHKKEVYAQIISEKESRLYYAEDVENDTIRCVYEFQGGVGNYFVDGEEIYFTSEGDGELEAGIWKVDLAGETAQRIFEKPAAQMYLAGEHYYASGAVQKEKDEITIYKQAADGKWEDIGSLDTKGIEGFKVLDIVLFQNRLLAAASGGLYTLEDGGNTWKAVYEGAGLIGGLIEVENKLYFTTDQIGGFNSYDGTMIAVMQDSSIKSLDVYSCWPKDIPVLCQEDNVCMYPAVNTSSAAGILLTYDLFDHKFTRSTDLAEGEVLIGTSKEGYYFYNTDNGKVNFALKNTK